MGNFENENKHDLRKASLWISFYIFLKNDKLKWKHAGYHIINVPNDYLKIIHQQFLISPLMVWFGIYRCLMEIIWTNCCWINHSWRPSIAGQCLITSTQLTTWHIYDFLLKNKPSRSRRFQPNLQQCEAKKMIKKVAER